MRNAKLRAKVDEFATIHDTPAQVNTNAVLCMLVVIFIMICM